jgi:hypothetical protein
VNLAGMNTRNGKRNVQTVKTNNMVLLNFLEISGIAFWICIISSAVFFIFACMHAKEPNDKIYEDELNKRRGDLSSFDDNTAF